jgi:hypothetical protein
MSPVRQNDVFGQLEHYNIDDNIETCRILYLLRYWNIGQKMANVYWAG